MDGTDSPTVRSSEPDELVLQRFEPVASLVSGCEVFIGDPALAESLGVRDAIAQLERGLKGGPSLVTERDRQGLSESVSCGFVHLFDFVDNLEVALASLDAPVGSWDLSDFRENGECWLRQRDETRFHEVEQEATVLLDERLNECKGCPHIAPTIGLHRIRWLRIEMSN